MTSKSKKIILITLGPLLLCGVWLCLLKDEPTKSNNHPWMHNDRRDESSLAVEPAAIVTQIHQDVAVTTVEKDKAHALVPNSINASSSSAISKIINSSLPYRERLTALRGLDVISLTSQDVQNLLQFLSGKNRDLYGSTIENAIKNDLLELLLGMPSLASEIGVLLSSVVLDESQDILWRDYVLQHYIFYYRNHYDTQAKQDNAFIDLKRSMDYALTRVNSTLAGTALINLSFLVAEYPDDFSENQWHHAISQTLESAEVALPSRIAAIQMLGKSNAPHCLPICVATIQAQDAPLLLKLASIGVLTTRSLQGSHQAMTQLNELEKSANTLLIKNALDQALQKISANWNEPS